MVKVYTQASEADRVKLLERKAWLQREFRSIDAQMIAAEESRNVAIERLACAINGAGQISVNEGRRFAAVIAENGKNSDLIDALLVFFPSLQRTPEAKGLPVDVS